MLNILGVEEFRSNIVSFLNVKDMVAAGMVNKQSHEYIHNDEFIWKSRFYMDFKQVLPTDRALTGALTMERVLGACAKALLLPKGMSAMKYEEKKELNQQESGITSQEEKPWVFKAALDLPPPTGRRLLKARRKNVQSYNDIAAEILPSSLIKRIDNSWWVGRFEHPKINESAINKGYKIYKLVLAVDFDIKKEIKTWKQLCQCIKRYGENFTYLDLEGDDLPGLITESDAYRYLHDSGTTETETKPYKKPVFYDWDRNWSKVKPLFDLLEIQQALCAAITEAHDDNDYYLCRYTSQLKWPYFHHSHRRHGNGEEDAIIKQILPMQARTHVIQMELDAKCEYASQLVAEGIRIVVEEDEDEDEAKEESKEEKEESKEEKEESKEEKEESKEEKEEKTELKPQEEKKEEKEDDNDDEDDDDDDAITDLLNDDQFNDDFFNNGHGQEMYDNCRTIYDFYITKCLDDSRLLLGIGFAHAFNEELALPLAHHLFPEARSQLKYICTDEMAIVYWPEQNIVFDLAWYFCHNMSAEKALKASRVKGNKKEAK